MKTGIKKNIAAFLVLIMAFFMVWGTNSLFPDFILDDEEDEDIEEVVEDEKKKEGALPIYIGYDIKAEKVKYIENAVKISWSVNTNYDDDFMIGRSIQIIDTQARALAAKSIGIMHARSKNFIVDTNLKPGKYYYVIVAKDKIAARDVELYRDVNYSSFPIIIEPPKEEETVTMIFAKKAGKQKILLTWNKVANKKYEYAIYRSTEMISSKPQFQKAAKITIVSNKDHFIDDSIDKGKRYFYAVMIEDTGGKRELLFKPNDNYTTEGVTLSVEAEVGADISFRMLSIEAKKEAKNVVITWTYTGKPQFNFFGLYRVEQHLKKFKDVRDKYIVREVNILKGKYVDTNPPPGNFYYGLMPYGKDYNDEYDILPGVHVTESTVAGEKKEAITVIKEKKRKKIKKKRKKRVYELKNIDKILKSTYYAGKYRWAIKELQDLAQNSDNKREAAKAKLFIGKSFVEIHQYRRAVRYLVLDDVMKHYPKEAIFWRDLAMGNIE
ncbi:MAG: hypothetical protein GY754_31315 [bacterium]|nr:hypothetical protein [bacterium]